MFDHRHYVPVLRWKRGEWRALKLVAESDRVLITPLFEITPKNLEPDSLETRLQQFAETMADCWGNRHAFIDTALLPASFRTPSGASALFELARRGKAIGLNLIPVTSLGRDRDEIESFRLTAEHLGTGTAIRIKKDQFANPELNRRVTDLCERLDLRPASVDLIFDYERTDPDAPRIAKLFSTIESLAQWRTVTVISGAFPKDLSNFSVGEHEHPRLDWLWWREQVVPPQGLIRIPAFGDYTTQHAVYSEPPARANFSASIRYASDSHWVVMRGEAVFKDDGPGFAQWPANAQLLSEREEFCGAEFSAGDDYIFKTGQQFKRTGNAETWLSAAVNHHLVFTSRQVAKLFDS